MIKNTIIRSAICLFMLAYVSTAQAQTKEATIAWIKEKIEKYGAYNNVTQVYNVNVSPCRISYTYIAKDSYSNLRNAYRLVEVSFSTTSIKSVEKIGNVVDIEFDAAVVANKVYFKSGNQEEYTYWKDENLSSKAIMANAESNLAERMKKAIEHLATFCEKKKEAF